jgi:hypothetical protein
MGLWVVAGVLALLGLLLLYDLFPYIRAEKSRLDIQRICDGSNLATAEKELQKRGFPHSAYTIGRGKAPNRLMVGVFYRSPVTAWVLAKIANVFPEQWSSRIYNALAQPGLSYDVDSSGTLTRRR